MPNAPSVLVTRRLPAQVEEALQKTHGAHLSPNDVALTSAELRDALATYDVILCTLGDRFDRALLAGGGHRTRLLANFGAGVNHIDLDAAREAGVAVTNTPDVLTDDTADLTMLLVLAAMRRATEGIAELRDETWTGWRPTHLLGTRVSGATLGIVGFGRIGQAVARRAHHGFGMSIRYFSRSSAGDDVAASLGASRCESLLELMASCDIISVHVPATKSTRHLIDAEAIGAMRPTAFFVNTARGDVVDEEALVHALRDRRIAGAGLDVFDGEPRVSRELVSFPTVFALPHIGSATVAGRVAMGMRAATNIDAFSRGAELPDRVA